MTVDKEMDAFKKRQQLIAELEVYTELEGTEIGEACTLLHRLAHYAYCLDDKFVKALDKELASQLSMFKDQCTIVERTETQTIKYRELEWFDH